MALRDTLSLVDLDRGLKPTATVLDHYVVGWGDAGFGGPCPVGEMGSEGEVVVGLLGEAEGDDGDEGFEDFLEVGGFGWG